MLNRRPVPDSFRAPFEVLPGTRDRRLLILCDHASNALPADYAHLGLPEAEFERHIAYDIGAAAVVRGMAEIINGKHRNGPIGTKTLSFIGKFTRFENFTPMMGGGPPHAPWDAE